VSLLTISDLRIEYALRDSSVAAVDGVDLNIEPGECFGLVGESGCGKSTLGMAILKLLAGNGGITKGSVTFDGRDLATFSESEIQKIRGNEIALIPQDPMTSLNPTQRIGKQIGEGYRIHRNASPEEARARALEVLKLVEMPNAEQRLDQYPHELSGGLRQRVMIAMALVCSPKLLIADEPTTALDVTIQAQILDILDDLREKLNMSILLITHDMGVIASRTDRVGVLYAGKVVEIAPTAELFSSMRHPYTQSLLAAVPKLDEIQSGRLSSIPGLPPDLSKPIVGCRFAPRCSMVQDNCLQAEPVLQSASATHAFSCFHPVQGPAKTSVTLSRRANEDHASNEDFLVVRSLEKSFPLRGSKLFSRSQASISAVSDVSFTLKRGEVLGLVGESGCGKTTIGRLLVGLEEPTGGSITFSTLQDQGLRGGAKRRLLARERQMMFQDPYSSLDPRKRVGSILAEPLEIQRTGTSESRRARVLELLDEVGLPPESIERYPHEFSGGQRQRIGLARALAVEPRLVIADEPVSALDVSIQAQILNLMKDLQEKRGLSYILISHDLAVVRYIADQIGVMYLGKLVEVGPADQVFSNPAHHYTAGLLRAVPATNVAEAKTRRGMQITGELPSAVNPPSGCRFRTRCPAAADICASWEPPLVTVGDGHTTSCHYPLRTPVTISQA